MCTKVVSVTWGAVLVCHDVLGTLGGFTGM